MVEVTCTRIALLNGSHIFLRTKWFSASFSVTALDFPRSWSCHVTKQEIASVLDTNGEDFFSQARLYLGDGISDAQYSFQAASRRPNTMRLSWATTNVRYDEEPRVALCFQEDNTTMELIPEFLNVLMDTTLVLKNLLARCKINKRKKIRQLAMRFSASEKARKRSLPHQAPTIEGMSGGLDDLVVKSEFPSGTPKFNSSTVSYEPASGRSTPTHPSNLTGLDGRAQHELRSPAMEGLKSPRQVLQSVLSSKSLNLGVYNATAGRFVSEEETGHGYGHQTPSCFERPNGLWNYVGVASHGQLKSLPSGYHGINESRREQAQADVQQRVRAIDQHGEAAQVPLTDDREHSLDRAGSSQFQLPVKADAYDGLDRVPPKHSQEFISARHGLFSWAQPRPPIRSPPTIDIGSVSRPAPTCHDVAVLKTLHQTPASEKGVLSHESRKLGMGNPGGSVWINSRKSNPGVKTRSFELSGSKRCSASHGQDGVIMLSDSEDEDFDNIEVDSGVLDDEGLLGRRVPCAMNGLADEPGSRFTTMPGLLNDSKPFSWRGSSASLNLNVRRVKEERSRSRLESEDRGMQSRSRKRKEWDDAHEDRTDTLAEGKRTKLNGFISEEQVSPCRGSLSRNRSGPDAQAFVAAGTGACIKVESDYQSEQNAIWQSGNHRNDKHASTFHCGSRLNRPQWKPINPTVHNCSEKLASTFNYESRSQWNTWISEAKTEVTSWEEWIQNGDSTTGGSCRADDQPAENVVNTSSPCDLEHQVAPLSLKKLDRNLDVVDFPQSDSEHFQSPRETLAVNLPPREENRVRARLQDLDDNPERSYTREIGKSNKEILSGVPQLEEVKVEREVIEVENDGDSDSVEEHVFEPRLFNDDEGTTGAGESVTKLLKSRAFVLPLEKGTHGRKFPGRRGRPPGIKLHLKPSKSVSQGINNCGTDRMTQSDKEPQKTSSQRFSRPARPVGKLRHCNSQGHPPAAIYEVEKNLVDVDEELQKTVPDSDYYCFDGDRGKEKIKPNQVWALYDDIDTMPRTLIRVKEVSTNGSFWVKASWLQPHTASKKTDRQKKTGFPRSCGDFEEPKETTIIRVLNCFSHKMEFTPKPDALIQVYPRKGEIWALHKKEDVKHARSEKEKQGKGNEENGNFRLVVILSNCGEERASDILVLRKRTGYRTLWEPGYEKGSLPIGNMDRFSHRVPAYKLTEKDYPDLNNSEIWDIDAAAVPTCQSKVT